MHSLPLVVVDLPATGPFSATHLLTVARRSTATSGRDPLCAS